MKTPENAEEDPDAPEQADGDNKQMEIPKWNTPLINCTAQV
jgi:hypothetical protein